MVKNFRWWLRVGQGVKFIQANLLIFNSLKYHHDNNVVNIMSNSTLIKAIDHEFSKFVRARDCGGKHFAECFTCRGSYDLDALSTGHFVRRRNTGLRWHNKNSHLQCTNCNITLDGNEEIYHLRIDLKYGPGTADMLRKVGRETKKWTNPELQSILAHYRKINNQRSLVYNLLYGEGK